MTLDKSGKDVLQLARPEAILTRSEVELAALIARVEFGEIHNVELEPGPRTERRFIPVKVQALLDAMEEYPAVSKIIIHEGLPTYFEVDGKGPWKYTKRIRV